ARRQMDDSVAQALEQAPDTPAGRQAAWYFANLDGFGEGATLADKDRFALPNAFRDVTTDEAMRNNWRSPAERIGAPPQSLAFTPVPDVIGEATLTAAKDRRWKLTFGVEEAPPHRIVQLNWERVHDFELGVREAEPADALTLSDLERRCPIVLGDV